MENSLEQFLDDLEKVADAMEKVADAMEKVAIERGYKEGLTVSVSLDYLVDLYEYLTEVKAELSAKPYRTVEDGYIEGGLGPGLWATYESRYAKLKEIIESAGSKKEISITIELLDQLLLINNYERHRLETVKKNNEYRLKEDLKVKNLIDKVLEERRIRNYLAENPSFRDSLIAESLKTPIEEKIPAYEELKKNIDLCFVGIEKEIANLRQQHEKIEDYPHVLKEAKKTLTELRKDLSKLGSEIANLYDFADPKKDSTINPKIKIK